MKEIIELIKWFLEKDIRTKNAISMLAAIGSAFVFFLISTNQPWFQEVKSYGPLAVGLAIVMVSIAAFILTSVVYSSVATSREKMLAVEEAEESQQRSIREALESLTDWQRRFLLRFIVEKRSQIPEFEVGHFRAVWDFEMAVLVQKGIVKEHRHAGVYEIVPMYRNYLLQNWDAETGTLG